MIENMVHKLQKAGAERPRLAVMREAAHEVARPIFFGVLIILMVYVPIATFRGMEGASVSADGHHRGHRRLRFAHPCLRLCARG